MEDMIAIELAVIIVAMFAIAVGFDCIKDGMCDIGAVIHDIIAAPVRHYRQKKLMEQMEREWENYLEKNRAKMVRNLMKEQQRHFSASIGEKHTVEEWGKALEELGYRCVSDDRRTPRRPDSVHIGNCGIYGRNRGTGISGIYKISGY